MIIPIELFTRDHSPVLLIPQDIRRIVSRCRKQLRIYGIIQPIIVISKQCLLNRHHSQLCQRLFVSILLDQLRIEIIHGRSRLKKCHKILPLRTPIGHMIYPARQKHSGQYTPKNPSILDQILFHKDLLFPSQTIQSCQTNERQCQKQHLRAELVSQDRQHDRRNLPKHKPTSRPSRCFRQSQEEKHSRRRQHGAGHCILDIQQMGQTAAPHKERKDEQYEAFSHPSRVPVPACLLIGPQKTGQGQ